MKRKSTIQGLSICAVLILVILSSGCATTNLAKSNITSKIQGRMDRKTLTTWDKYYLWRQNEKTWSEYTIDAGKQEIFVAYTGHRGSKIMRSAGPVLLEVDFAPNVAYQIDGESFDKHMYFIIRDKRTGTAVLRYGPVDVVSFKPPPPKVIPIPIISFFH